MIVVVLIVVAVLVGLVVRKLRNHRSSSEPATTVVSYAARPRELRKKRTKVYL